MYEDIYGSIRLVVKVWKNQKCPWIKEYKSWLSRTIEYWEKREKTKDKGSSLKSDMEETPRDIILKKERS